MSELEDHPTIFCHSRAGGNPVPAFAGSQSKLGPRLRGDDDADFVSATGKCAVGSAALDPTYRGYGICSPGRVRALPSLHVHAATSAAGRISMAMRVGASAEGGLRFANSPYTGCDLTRTLAGMKTTEMRNDSGVVTGFSVSNLFLGRRAVPGIVDSIQGARLVRKHLPFRFGGRDDFCEFVVDGKTFLVIEPFGDSNEYWVIAEPPAPQCSPLAKVRDAFERHRVLFGLYAG